MRDMGDATGYGPTDGDTEFEARLRELLEEQTDVLGTSEAPYATIVRQGRTSRRRRVFAAGAGLAALVAVPGTAVAMHYQPGDGGQAVLPAHGALPSAQASATQLQPSAPVRASGPEGPVTPGQLADGITLERAAEALEGCLSFDAKHQAADSPFRHDLGKPEDYRVILALNATGDMNSPGDGIRVVAVGTPGGTPVRLICTDKGGETQGVSTSSGDTGAPGRGPVVPDDNAFRLYKQDGATGPGLPYHFPFRWGSVGTVEHGVAKVTVSWGGVTRQAALDHGYFAATGVLAAAEDSLPHIKGYDAAGKLVYDSTQDKAYE
ncbi:hypothetical protein [Actinacidiphila glaucinigra]|uniref:hypothetical protein n=1 Tax=Actinacidiphila glaucinigra TaxID=235986 RepID=UPI0029BBC32D|nr:hypothetical protein [Streptomyces sp. PA03-3a]